MVRRHRPRRACGPREPMSDYGRLVVVNCAVCARFPSVKISRQFRPTSPRFGLESTALGASGKFPPVWELGQVLCESTEGRLCLILLDFGQDFTNFVQIWPDSRRFQPTLGRLRSNLGHRRPKSAQFGRNRPQSGADFGQLVWHNASDFSQAPTNNCGFRRAQQGDDSGMLVEQRSVSAGAWRVSVG